VVALFMPVATKWAQDRQSRSKWMSGWMDVHLHGWMDGHLGLGASESTGSALGGFTSSQKALAEDSSVPGRGWAPGSL
jgi:hypothetical protein